MSNEPEVEELILPGLVEKKDEEDKEKADKVTGQRVKQLNLGEDCDDDLDTEDEEDVSQRFLSIYTASYPISCGKERV